MIGYYVHFEHNVSRYNKKPRLQIEIPTLFGIIEISCFQIIQINTDWTNNRIFFFSLLFFSINFPSKFFRRPFSLHPSPLETETFFIRNRKEQLTTLHCSSTRISSDSRTKLAQINSAFPFSVAFHRSSASRRDTSVARCCNST